MYHSFTHDRDSPRGSPRTSPRGSPQPSPRGSPQTSPRGSPQLSPRGSPQTSPRGSCQSSPRSSPSHRSNLSRSPSPTPRSYRVPVARSDSSSERSSSRLKISFSCPDLLDESTGSSGKGLSSSVRVAVTTSSSAHLDSSLKQRNSNPSLILPQVAAIISNPFGPLNMLRARARGRRKASLDVPRQVSVSKYMRRECSTLLTSKSKSQGHKIQDDAIDDISFGPSPVCIVISRAGEERVKELEEVDGGLFPGVSKFLQGSMDKLPSSPSPSTDSEVGPFRRETGMEYKEGEACPPQPMHVLIENPESETRWYFKYFLGKVHHNYLCYDPDKSPFFLSVVNSGSIYRCILWRKVGNKRLHIKQGSTGKWPTPKAILEKFSMTKYDKNVKEVATANIQRDLLTLEEQEGAVNFKFGVLYSKAGQKSDDEMFSNECSSPSFDRFLELLGNEVVLEGWEHYRGGLDNKNNSTGTHSVYTVFEGHEIMFHVSTMLPYTSDNKQQLERKRHVGNDIIVIIFMDGDTHEEAYEAALNFDPFCMRSHFNHIFALVTHNRERGVYHVVVHSAESVPAFGPPIPPSGEFSDHIAFRDFLLAKLINGEKAAYCTPTFAVKRERTLGMLLKGVEQKCNTEYRRAMTVPVIYPQNSPNSNRRYLELEHSFTEFGQRLKVEKIITGHHPTSKRTTVAPNKDPWEMVCVAKEFPYQMSCGDFCDDGTLIVSTKSDGAYFLYKDGSYTLIVDKSVPIGQIMVAHRHQVLLLRTSYAKESNYFYAIPLKHFYTDKLKIVTRSTLAPYHIPYTKGCHLFCTAPLDGQFLRVAVAIKTKVYMLAWKHPATMSINGSPVTPRTPPNPIDSFIKHRELTLPDVPVLMTLLDERPSGKLCVSYQKQTVVDAIDEIRASTQRIPNLDIAKAKLTTLTSIHSNGRSELLIGYNLTCQLITLHDGTAYNSVEIIWNSEPRELVYMSPYILAFTANTIEIRMASNGSLMQTITVPDLHLLSKKGDLYFTSSRLLHQFKDDARMIKPDIKIPKNLDKKGFSSSLQLDIPDMVYVYKIAVENMLGRRDSNASVSSIGSITSVQSVQSTFSCDDRLPLRGNSSRRRMSEDIPEDATSLDFVHPLSAAETMERVATFSFSSSPPDETGGSRKRFAARRKLLVLNANPLTESESETLDLANGVESSGQLSVLDAECSSPDSGVVQDDFSMCPPMKVKNGRLGMPNGHTFIHSQSSPSILRDNETLLPCT